MATPQVSWLEGLTDETRERVFVVMRKIRHESTQYHQRGTWMSRRAGMTILVGSAHFDEIVRGEALSFYLRALSKGLCPTEALTCAKQEVRKVIESHNSQRKDVNWKRADITADGTVEYAHKQIVDAVVGR